MQEFSDKDTDKRNIFRALLEQHSDQLFQSVQKSIPEEILLSILTRQGLAALWYQKMNEYPELGYSSSFAESINKHTMGVAALHAAQQKVLSDVDAIFTRDEIPYVVIKGINNACTLYPKPYLRPCTDIDVLVPVSQQAPAIRLLHSHGFSIEADQNTISHEVMAIKNTVTIDLHWHLLRPGRLRIDVTDWLLGQSRRLNSFNGISETASLFIMLVHPVFTKYLNSPVSILVHMMDIHRLLSSGKIEEEILGEVLGDTGSRTAAWLSLYWYHWLSGNEEVAGFINAIKPGAVHRCYLESWIKNAWISRFWQHRWLVKSAFGIALQDSLSDAFKAFRTLRQQKQDSDRQLDAIKLAVAGKL